MTVEHDFAGDALPIQVEAEARADADRFYGEAPMPGWEAPEAARARRSAWITIAAGALLALVGTAGLVREDLDTPPKDSGSQAVAAANVPRGSGIVMSTTMLPIAALGNPDEDIVDEDPEPVPVQTPDAPAVPEAETPRTPGAPSLSITRVGAEWRIEAHGASRLAAAQQLAQASGSPLQGDVAQLATTRPLDLRWQGRLRDGAWPAVLGNAVSFASRCDTRRCQVFILEGRRATAPEAADDELAIARPVIPMPTPADPREVAAAVLRQSDSPDPRMASHHD